MSVSRGPAAVAASAGGRNVVERFFANGGLSKMVLSDEEQAELVGTVAKHLSVLRQIPDFLAYLHVDETCAEVRPSGVCDGRGVFATRDIKAHELVTLYPASNELSLCANRERGVVHRWQAETYASPRPDACHVQRPPVLRRQRAPPRGGPAPPQPGFLGHLVNDAALPPTDAEDIEYAQRYLTATTNETNCHAVPFPSGMVAVAASKDLAAGEELLMSYTFGYDAGFMSEMMAKPELRKKMLTNAFAAEMKVAASRWNNSPPRRSKFTPRRSSSRGSSSWTPRETNRRIAARRRR